MSAELENFKASLTAHLDWFAERGRMVRFWWRDDDAQRETPELARLVGLSEALSVPLHLAVIPEGAEAGLAQAVGPLVVPMVHGWAHLNHAPEGAKKAEFGHPRTDRKSTRLNSSH